MDRKYLLKLSKKKIADHYQSLDEKYVESSDLVRELKENLKLKERVGEFAENYKEQLEQIRQAIYAVLSVKFPKKPLPPHQQQRCPNCYPDDYEANVLSEEERLLNYLLDIIILNFPEKTEQPYGYINRR
tara:strand:- start:132 stop:521 length:390 start_codon:yes stop_codon:yes gene_type:complete